MCVIVHGDPTFIMKFSERDMECPLVWAKMAQGILFQVQTFADPHACGTNQKEGICEEVISLSQLVIEKPVEFRRNRSWKIEIARR